MIESVKKQKNKTALRATFATIFQFKKVEKHISILMRDMENKIKMSKMDIVKI